MHPWNGSIKSYNTCLSLNIFSTRFLITCTPLQIPSVKQHEWFHTHSIKRFMKFHPIFPFNLSIIFDWRYIAIFLNKQIMITYEKIPRKSALIKLLNIYSASKLIASNLYSTTTKTQYQITKVFTNGITEFQLDSYSKCLKIFCIKPYIELLIFSSNRFCFNTIKISPQVMVQFDEQVSNTILIECFLATVIG